MTSAKLDGPRKKPASGGAAKQLVVFVHGYGADGNDLIGLGDQWQNVLPDAEFVSPNAPEPCGMNPMGRQWFELTMRDPDEYLRGVNKAGPVFNEFIDAELARLELDDSALALVGFSQGTMMSLHCGLRRKKSPAAIVGYSGTMIAPEKLKEEISVKPPVLLVHGDMDDVIPVQAMPLAAEALKDAGVTVQTHVSNGVGHGIDLKGLELGGGFLNQAFSG